MVKRGLTKMHFEFHHYEADYREEGLLHFKIPRNGSNLEKVVGINKKKLSKFWFTT